MLRLFLLVCCFTACFARADTLSAIKDIEKLRAQVDSNRKKLEHTVDSLYHKQMGNDTSGTLRADLQRDSTAAAILAAGEKRKEQKTWRLRAGGFVAVLAALMGYRLMQRRRKAQEREQSGREDPR